MFVCSSVRSCVCVRVNVFFAVCVCGRVRGAGSVLRLACLAPPAAQPCELFCRSSCFSLALRSHSSALCVRAAAPLERRFWASARHVQRLQAAANEVQRIHTRRSFSRRAPARAGRFLARAERRELPPRRLKEESLHRHSGPPPQQQDQDDEDRRGRSRRPEARGLRRFVLSRIPNRRFARLLRAS